MSEPEKLSEDMGPKNQSTSVGSDIKERQHATLLRNELIAGNSMIADRVIKLAQAVTCEKGHRLIDQGSVDDCVYFIIIGRVEVLINKRHIDFRGAPHTVGEMAAKRAGEVRTADVVVQSDTFEALVLSGSDFRSIMHEFPTFSSHLDDLIDTLTREKIRQLGEKEERQPASWNFICGIAGAVACGGAALVCWVVATGLAEGILYSTVTGLIVFICLQLINPVLRYRNLAAAAGYCLIALITYSSFSFMLTIDGKEFDFPLIDFSINTEMKVGTLIVGCVALLVLAWICGRFDLMLGRADKR